MDVRESEVHSTVDWDVPHNTRNRGSMYVNEIHCASVHTFQFMIRDLAKVRFMDATAVRSDCFCNSIFSYAQECHHDFNIGYNGPQKRRTAIKVPARNGGVKTSRS